MAGVHGIAVYRRTHNPSRWRPPGAESAFIKSTRVNARYVNSINIGMMIIIIFTMLCPFVCPSITLWNRIAIIISVWAWRMVAILRRRAKGPVQCHINNSRHFRHLPAGAWTAHASRSADESAYSRDESEIVIGVRASTSKKMMRLRPSYAQLDRTGSVWGNPNPIKMESFFHSFRPHWRTHERKTWCDLDIATIYSVEILVRFFAPENWSHWTIVWRYLCDPAFSRFDRTAMTTCDRETKGRTDGRT